MMTMRQLRAHTASQFLMTAHGFLRTVSMHPEASRETQRDALAIMEAMRVNIPSGSLVVGVPSNARFGDEVRVLRGTINDLAALRLEMETRTDGFLVARYVAAAERLAEDAKGALTE